jgi:hypothetical protein
MGGVTIRRAEREDADFLLELATHEDVEPFLGAMAARDRESILAEIERSLAEPEEFGRFVIEIDGQLAGSMGFLVGSRH